MLAGATAGWGGWLREQGCALYEALWRPLKEAPWGDWYDFWFGNVLVGWDPRFIVMFALPLMLLLWLWPRRHIRLGVALTGLIFVGYAFGLIFLAFWLAVCVSFYILSERFAYEAQRTDVWRWGPPIAAISIIAVAYTLFMALGGVRIAGDLNAWLFEHAPFLWPIGARNLPWEGYQPQVAELLTGDKPRIPPLFFAIFIVPQINGLVIFTIRMIHYFSELKRGTIIPERRTLLGFMAFNTFAPVLMQGPIERFRDFDDQMEAGLPARRVEDLLAGGGRILLGLAKNLISVLYLWPIVDFARHQYYAAPLAIENYWLLFFSPHAQVFLLYFYFSAYCDAAIGLARLCGYRVTENFRRPWLARSLTDMWRRWHITLSFILRDYIFLPLARRRWPLVTLLVVTFIVCGLLHNYNPAFILWGAVMGLLISINQKFARWLRTLDREPQRPLSRVRRLWLRLQPLPMLCAWALTINAFCFSAPIAFGGLNGLVALWETFRRPVVWLLPQLAEISALFAG